MKRNRIVARGVAVGMLGCVMMPGLSGAADDPAEDMIPVRRAAFDLQGKLFDFVRAGAKAESEPKQFADAAAAMESWGQRIPLAFPPGSDKGFDTKAKPNVWTDREGFLKAAATFTDAATKLAQLAKVDDKGFYDEVGAVGQACGACHKAYRAR